MKVLARAKINWALNILGCREDGYHDMDMLMQRIELCDELYIEPAGQLTLTVTDGCGATIPAGGENLVLRAARALCDEARAARGARIRLIKRIPVRAGLGGGSADAAAALCALNRMWELDLDERALVRIGLGLGADVPFCLQCEPARARGLGERLDPCVRPPRPVPLVILHPGAGLSTPRMFKAWDALARQTPRDLEAADIDRCVRALASGDLRGMAEASRNMLYPCAVDAMPDIARARRSLLDQGAAFAAMTGSGSAVFGAFESVETAETAAHALGDGAILTYTH